MYTEHAAALGTIKMRMSVIILKFTLALTDLVFRQPASVFYPMEQMIL